MSTPPTPETDAAWASWPYAGPGVHANFARKLERERDEARELHKKSLREREAAERESDATLERAHRAERERDEARDQLQAMREAIREVSLQLTFAEKVSGASVLHIYVYDALIKLQPFLS